MKELLFAGSGVLLIFLSGMVIESCISLNKRWGLMFGVFMLNVGVVLLIISRQPLP